MQASQRDAMQAALNANRALQNQLQLVKEHIDKFHHDNGIQAVSIKQLRTNPSMFLWPVPTLKTAVLSSAVMHAFKCKFALIMTQPALHRLLHAYKELLISKYTLKDAGHH